MAARRQGHPRRAIANAYALAVVVKHGKHKRREKVVIARGTYAAAAGATGTATVHLTTAGKTRLRQAAPHLLSPKLVISVTRGKSLEHTVSLAAGT